MLVRRVARPMLAAVFVAGGVDTLRHPEPRVGKAERVAPKIAARLPVQLPQDTETLVRIDAGVKVGAGLMLATGHLPRLAAVALASSLVPTTAAGHRFWELPAGAGRAGERLHFLKNLGLLGGLLIAAVDTSGRPGLGWRARHAGAAAARRVPAAAHR